MLYINNITDIYFRDNTNLRHNTYNLFTDIKHYSKIIGNNSSNRNAFQLTTL